MANNMHRTNLFIIFCTLFAQTTFAAIIPTSLDNGTEGLAYKEVTFTSNKTNPKDSSIRWKVLQAPPGITIDEKNGKYSGKPTRAGNYTLSVLVYQAIGSRLDLKDSTTITHTISATTSPTINSLTLPTGQFDMLYAPYSLTATGGMPVSAGVYTWEALPLGSNEFQNIPQGMSLSKSGVLSGVPTSRAPVPQSSRIYTFIARATDSVGKSATANYTLVINPALPPTILGQCPLPDGIEQIKYKDYKMTGSGGKPPYFWTIQPPQDFPAGLKFDYQTGVISGTPMTYGNFTFQINLVDKNGFSVNKSCSISILPIPHITTNSIFNCATAGKPICQEIEAIGGSTPYKWEILPPLPSNASNLTISTSGGSKGVLCGNFSSSSNNTTVTVKVTDNVTSKFTTKSFTFTVRDQLSITSSCPPTEWTSGTPISPILLSANGGSGNYTWSKFESFNKPWPSGLSIVGNKIQGTPVVSTTTNYTIAYQVTDSCGNTANKTCPITVYPILAITNNCPLNTAILGTSYYSANLTVSGGKPPYTWSLVSPNTGLPPGLTLNATTGEISGTPTTAGIFPFTYTVTDSFSQNVTKNCTIEVQEIAILTCVKEIWVVISYMPGGHKCNSAKYNIYANGINIMVSNLNNVTGIDDWQDNPGGAASISGYANGNGSESSFNTPTGIAVASNGDVTVADKNNNLIRRITQQSIANSSQFGSFSVLNFGNMTANVTTLAGNLFRSGFVDGTGTAASFTGAKGVSIDGNGTIYVADTGNNRIRMITPNGIVSTLAGSGTKGFGDGNGTSSIFSGPSGVAVDGNGTIYVADTDNNRIRKITPNGIVSTLGGNGTAGFADGNGTAAVFSGPSGVAVDGNGTIYVADTGNNRIRKITPNGIVSTLVGNGTAGFANGNGTAAVFSGPSGVAVDQNGTIYVADTGNNRIRKITPNGIVSTLAGNGTAGFGDGNGTAAVFSGPSGIAVDGNGTIYVADTGNHRIRMINAANATTTLAGVGTFMLPEPYKSTAYARYNRVLISGEKLEKIAKKSGSSQNILFTANCSSSICSHDNNSTVVLGNNSTVGVGKLSVYTTNSTSGIFPEGNPIKPSIDFSANAFESVPVCNGTTGNSMPTFKSFSSSNVISSPSSKGLPVNYSSMALISRNNTASDPLQNALIASASYKISNYEITNQQYADFLKAVAKTDPNNLYNSLMSNNGIKRSASNGSFSYSVGSGSDNYPVTYVSWLDAARYANWLANGKPTGSSGPKTTENGAYNLASSSIVRNTINPNTGAPPTFWLLNESEWYTSAYLKSDATALWSYPTQSNSAPDPTGSKPNNLANFGGVFGETTPVGFFNQSPGPFGTFDQAGNVREWTETIDSNSGKAMRIIRGGSWADPASAMRADESHIADPSLEDDKTGFRIGGAP